MKQLLPALFLLFVIKANSQALILTQANNEPIVGDTSRVHVLDTSAFTSGMPISVTGSNVVWNFQNLNTPPTMVTSAYVSTTAVSGASAYPGATYVQKQGNLNTYFKSVTSPTTQTEFMGVSSSSLNMNFTNTAVAAKYPMTFGSTVNDNFSGSFTFSISGTVNGNVVTTADGAGTLNLMDGISLTNVLRVKSVQSMTMTSGFFPVGNIKQTNYYFYHASQKFPVLTINYTSMALTGQSPTVTAGATGNTSHFVVGVKENQFMESSLTVYPNPTSDLLHFDVPAMKSPEKICIYTQLGQCVFSNSYQEEINVAQLESGIYFIEIKGANGTVRKKFIKE